MAIDDAGAGFASLRHTVRIAPDIVKLDLSLTRDIDSTARSARSRRRSSRSRTRWASPRGRGHRDGEELATLRELGVGYGQGFHLAEPGPLP